MGFWDRQVTRFYAMGIEIDPADLEVLEHGGEVVHLHHLLAPEWAGGYRIERAQDQNGEPVIVPEILQIPELDDRIITYFETEVGEIWRNYPSFVGLLDEAWHAEDRLMGPRMDQWHFYRFWNCNSFPDRDVIEEMCAASDRRLQSTLHYELEHVFNYEENKDHGADLGLLWAFENDKARLSESDWREVERFLEMDFDDDDADNEEDALQQALASYQACMEAGILLPANPTEEESARLKPLFYPPMSEFLTPYLNRQWEGMLARQKYIKFRVTEHMDAAQRYRFDYEEEDE